MGVFLSRPILASEKLEIHPLVGDFYVFTTYKLLDGEPFPSNGLYVVTPSGIVMIDTPWDAEQTLPLLDQLEKRHGKKVVMCLVTHFHDDRTAGLEILNSRQIMTYSSKLTGDLCRTRKEKEAAFQFEGNTSFTLAGLTLEVFYPGEGHSRDNVVIWFPEARVLYGGCLVKSGTANGLGNVADANLEQWPVSLRNVIDRFPQPAFVIPGHGSWSDGQGLQRTLQLLRAPKGPA
jgi:glyoxylase-like metal-dependent hydrolase (beta-lactamase superfamily II)